MRLIVAVALDSSADLGHVSACRPACLATKATDTVMGSRTRSGREHMCVRCLFLSEKAAVPVLRIVS